MWAKASKSYCRKRPRRLAVSLYKCQERPVSEQSAIFFKKLFVSGRKKQERSSKSHEISLMVRVISGCFGDRLTSLRPSLKLEHYAVPRPWVVRLFGRRARFLGTTKAQSTQDPSNGRKRGHFRDVDEISLFDNRRSKNHMPIPLM